MDMKFLDKPMTKEELTELFKSRRRGRSTRSSCPAYAVHPVNTGLAISHGQRLLDRPPEPVIGPAGGWTRWRAMTPQSLSALLTTSSNASAPSVFAAFTLSCLPSSPISRWRTTVACVISGAMPSSRRA